MVQGSTVYGPKDGIHLKVIDKLLDPGLRRDDGVRINKRFLKGNGAYLSQENRHSGRNEVETRNPVCSNSAHSGFPLPDQVRHRLRGNDVVTGYFGLSKCHFP